MPKPKILKSKHPALKGQKPLKSVDKIEKKIPEGLYWKLRLAAEAREHEHTRLQFCIKAKQYHSEELKKISAMAEAAQLKLSGSQKAISTQNKVVKEGEDDYSKTKLEVETFLGFGLENCEICPETLNVTKGG